MSNGPTLVPRKETVYDGPEVDIFKPKSFNNSAQKPTSGKETVHEGDVPEFITRRFSKSELQQAIAQPPQTETIHQGPIPDMFTKLGRIAHDLVMPDRETIYQGPEVAIRKAEYVNHSASSENGEPRKETVYDESTFVAARIDTSAARTLVTQMVQRASVRFFAVAVLAVIELYFCRENLVLAISSGAISVTFCVVGFYTYKLSLKALLFAIGMYAVTTLFMVSSAVMNERMLEMLVPLFSRGFMMYNLLRTYGLLVDLHLLESET
jgi:hypothetical protein